MRARYLVVADGANSRFGRALGTSRERTWPYATAIRNYFASPLHDTPAIELTVDLTDRNGMSITGYGWVFPLGDGTVNVGAGVVSTAKEFRAINTTHLLEQFATDIAERWRIEPDAPLGAPASGRVPMGGSVGPTAGPTWLVIGDAAGSANPFVGAGIEYAYETGRIAGDVLDEALRENNATVLQRYPAVLARELRHVLQDRASLRPVRRSAGDDAPPLADGHEAELARRPRRSPGHQRAATVARRPARARATASPARSVASRPVLDRCA